MNKYNKKQLTSLKFLHSHEMGSEFILRMLAIYAKDIPERIEEIKSAIQKNEHDSLRISIHTLASHIRDLGAADTHQRLVSIENQDFSSMNQLDISSKVTPILKECTIILDEIKSHQDELEKA